jgi:hypothetical protein
MEAMDGLQGPRAAEFQALATRLRGNGSLFVGTHHFWIADYTTHHTPTFFISVRMHSNRTRPSEMVNGENLLGWHLADGAVFTYQHGDEYSAIFPAWAWTKIPGLAFFIIQMRFFLHPLIHLGITARQNVTEKPGEFGALGPMSFVGGVCLPSSLCLSAMDFQGSFLLLSLQCASTSIFSSP